MSAIFISDVHLKDGTGLKTRLVIRFLEEVACHFDTIYILGDLFDVWPGTRGYFIKHYRPVIQSMKHLTDQGVQIHYVEGNHDFRLGSFFSDTLGITIHPDHHIESWNGRTIFMTHGDHIPKVQWYNRCLRSVLRNDLFHFSLKALPSATVFRLGSRWSNLSRKMGSYGREEADKQVRSFYRSNAEVLFNQGYDVVLMGHTHLPDDYVQKENGRARRYINTGDWVRNFTYVEFDGVDFSIKIHPIRNP